ncbi:TRPM8 channel-associated factor homolog [Boleophthalmus pectinirostris]|uniref:TRPM8 channel-associated factor homolog n=1 Tax=Boleophthalmus pectinirostris TaxID=150288 RepID=UPI0024300051|nr:TRPM8 channel-associated factor homolog [Boleophthalmus pectinirostris]
MWGHGSELTLLVMYTMLCFLIYGPDVTMATSESQQQAYSSIMNGITEVNFEGSSVPGIFILSGDHSFPLVTNSEGKVQAAASLYGEGRLVALCHETFLTTLPNLVENSLNWLRGDSNNMSIGVHESVRGVADSPFKTNFQIRVMQKFSGDQGIKVFVTDAFSVEGSEKEIIAFMKAGGGVLIAAQAWHWAYRHPGGNALLEYWGNKVSSVAGVYFFPESGERKRISIEPRIPSWKNVEVSDSFTKDRKNLLNGVSELSFGKTSLGSEILVHGPLSFPIAWDNSQVFLAGGYYGKGRIIATAHENLLVTNEKFWDNALHWLDQGRMGVIGVDDYHTLPPLLNSGLNIEVTEFRPGLSVYLATTWKDTYIREMLEFVAEGGGLVVGGQAWTFIQRSDLNYLTNCPGNKILNPMGLTQLSTKVSGGIYKAPDPSAPVKDHHFSHLLKLFVGYMLEDKALTPEDEQTLSARTLHISSFLQIHNHQSYFYQQTVSKLVDIFKKAGLPQASRDSPATNTRDKLLLSLAAEVHKVCPDPDDLKQSLLRHTQLLTVQDLRVRVSVDTGDGEEWVSTGLYLPPAFKSNITFPTEMVKKGWKVQISCQSDTLYHKDDLYRAPAVTERFPVLSQTMQVQNFWGGLIYLIAPSNTKLTGVDVVVHQAVRAPYYKSGLMHAGYPVMAQTPKAAVVTSLSEIQKEGLWGPLHELGHNQQRWQTEFSPHTNEATCNLWSVFITETVLGFTKDMYQAAELTHEYRNGIIETYVNNGRKLDDWNTWLALETYLQLQEKFGWEPFKKVFAAYHAMDDATIPWDNPGKMNLYTVTFSEVVGMDLTGFLKSWGWPIESATEQKLSKLPAWTDHPMAKYNK